MIKMKENRYYEIRYYLGKIKCKIIFHSERKCLIKYLENGLVGNKKVGYKEVNKYDKDITLTRFLWKKRK